MSFLVEKADGLKNDGSENSMFIVSSKVVVLHWSYMLTMYVVGKGIGK